LQKKIWKQHFIYIICKNFYWFEQIHVGNIAFETKGEDLRAYFETFGELSVFTLSQPRQDYHRQEVAVTFILIKNETFFKIKIRYTFGLVTPKFLNFPKHSESDVRG
jgi:RNA recognition motif-containing protein